MKLGLSVRVCAAALVLAAALTGLVVREGLARAHGREVTLAIDAYDPRSVLSGHYVRFQLIDTTPPGQPCPPGTQAPNADWVGLSRADGRYRVTGAAASRHEAQALGEVVVRGHATCAGHLEDAARPIRLDVGVDRMHTDQRHAEAIARALTARDGPPALAVISVDDSGKARLKGLIVQGRRIGLSWF